MFQYLITLEPLGFLYGSAGRFLSPDNLVGRAGVNFPPSAATLSGLFAAHYGAETMKADANWMFAGPFWSMVQDPQDFYVPTPMNCLVREGQIEQVLDWNGTAWEPGMSGKFDKRGWLPIRQWLEINSGQKIEPDPWEFAPHLHPRLELDQRRVQANETQGSLFLENAVLLKPGVCLAYLSSHPLPAGWYRFGGEGHLVDVQCHDLHADTQELLQKPAGTNFATITPGLWGSNRLSTRWPMQEQDQPIWTDPVVLTERPQPYRYRLGGTGTGRRLSRGRYAVPAGTVYVLQKPLDPWHAWPEAWFPKEGYSLKRWGCGLSLPLPILN